MTFSLFTHGVLLAALLAEEPAPPAEEPAPPPVQTDRITTHPTPGALELSWSDAEERLQGAVLPPLPVAGADLRVSVAIGSFEGKSHDGPVTFALKNADLHYDESATVKKDGVSFATTFHPPEDGDYTLDVTWRSTHTKVVHATIPVNSAPVPRWPWIALGGIAAVVILAFGVRSAVRSRG